MVNNSDPGFLKIYRKFFDHFLWAEDREYSKAEAWIDLLRTARYKEGNSCELVNGQPVEWKRGELLASVRFLKNRWNWNSTGKVTRFLKMLEKQDMIERKTEQGITVISICNYSTYNPLDNDNRTVTEQQQNSNGTPTEQWRGQNSKKVKKEKKEKKEEEGDGKPSAIPELSEVKDYFKENGYDPNVAEKAFNYYNASVEDTRRQFWRDSNGNKVRNWKMKMRAVWFKDKNKLSKQKKSPFRPGAIQL